MSEKLVRVGRFSGTFGLKGEVKVSIISDFADERFQVGKTLLLKSKTDLTPLVIRSVRYHKNQALIAFENYPDLTSIEGLARGDFMVSVNEFSTSEGFHSIDFKGCDVYDESNIKRGVVLQWEEGSTHGLIRVQSDEKMILIPVVDAFILKKDKKNKRIVVRWLEGL